MVSLTKVAIMKRVASLGVATPSAAADPIMVGLKRKVNVEIVNVAETNLPQVQMGSWSGLWEPFRSVNRNHCHDQLLQLLGVKPR